MHSPEKREPFGNRLHEFTKSFFKLAEYTLITGVIYFLAEAAESPALLAVSSVAMICLALAVAARMNTLTLFDWRRANTEFGKGAWFLLDAILFLLFGLVVIFSIRDAVALMETGVGI